MPAPAASQVQYLFRQDTGPDERIFNSARVRPRRMFQSQAHQQSGNRYNPGNSNHRQWAELAIEGSLDITDLLLHFIAFAPYKYTAASGTGATAKKDKWEFNALAGATPTGFTAPKVWNTLKAINWANSGPDYTAGEPTLQNLEINFDAGGDSMLTAAYLAQEYAEVTGGDAGALTADGLQAVNPILPLNSDIRVSLSSGRLAQFMEPEAVLGARFSWSDIIEPVFGANQDDRGWTDTVESMLTADLRIRFVANSEYLSYDLVDDLVFVRLWSGNLDDDTKDGWSITQLASFREVPNGPGAQQNLQEVELSFLPVARVDGNANADTLIEYESTTGSGRTGLLSGDTDGIDEDESTGYVPAGLNEISWHTDDDFITVGAADADNVNWPKNWEPESITIGSTVHPLTYHAGSRKWRTGRVTALPSEMGTGTEKQATIKWKFTAATYLSAEFKGTSVPNFNT